MRFRCSTPFKQVVSDDFFSNFTSLVPFKTKRMYLHPLRALCLSRRDPARLTTNIHINQTSASFLRVLIHSDLFVPKIQTLIDTLCNLQHAVITNQWSLSYSSQNGFARLRSVTGARGTVMIASRGAERVLTSPRSRPADELSNPSLRYDNFLWYPISKYAPSENNNSGENNSQSLIVVTTWL